MSIRPRGAVQRHGFPRRDPLECLRYLEKLKGRLKKKFDQLEILIAVAELLAI